MRRFRGARGDPFPLVSPLGEYHGVGTESTPPSRLCSGTDGNGWEPRERINFIEACEARVDAAMRQVSYDLALGLFGGVGLLSNEEFDEFKRSRAGWRYMLKELLDLEYRSYLASAGKFSGISAWLPSEKLP